MTKLTAESDDVLTRTLSVYAGMVEQVLNNPARWLGSDEDPPPSASPPRKLLDKVRDRVLGDITPSSSRWNELPIQKRTRWWLRRIAVTAGVAAAAPRFAGMVADRLPVQAALGASASGLAVCAVAREHGVVTAAEWVPLLAKVLFDREVTTAATPPPAHDSQRALEQAAADTTEPPSGMAALTAGSQRGVRALWRLATHLLELNKTLQTRPRGNRLSPAMSMGPR